MARDHANITTSIWGHPDFRALPPLQQWLYLQMWTHPDTSYVGVLDWRPGKQAQLSEGTTADFIRGVVPLLQERMFVVLDEDTEEILLRPYLRWDGLLKQPKLAVSMTNAYAATGSNLLRGVVIHELLKLRREHPEYRAWDVPQVGQILKHPAIDPASLTPDQPSALPIPLPIGLPKALPLGLPQTLGSGLGLRTATATATTTEASLLEDPGDAKLKETRLPKSWAPTATHFALAKARGVDIMAEADAFRLHAETHDRHAARWNAAFTTWLKKARVSSTALVEDGKEWMYR